MPKNYRIPDLFSYYEIDSNGCWLWKGAVGSEGYGTNRRNGKTVRMHRVYYEQFVGPIPDGMQICHRCDVRRCVNPNHLFPGTNQDNVDDREAKGRNKLPPKGERHNKAKLTEAQVLEARRLWSEGFAIRALARSYQVDRKTMSCAIKGKHWKNVGKEPNDEPHA
ncbi:hypothetical protein UA17_01737 [Burkholderia multivorans]|uniref:HNH endonuclease n=1 Tax=Burkholderia multivorans TaxID=87883 RepID=UPI0009E0CD5C|nr:HNH endonuclease [Burkholderia multivorans]SAK19108.1 hypothetical protein UA17_01737 [Burkholderia multivorans]